jgi:hypothetical protein
MKIKNEKSRTFKKQVYHGNFQGSLQPDFSCWDKYDDYDAENG